MMSQVRLGSSYVTKFGAAALLVALVLLAAGVNTYTNLAPQLSSGARAELLSGLVSMFLVFVIGLIFVGAALGRETLSSLNILTTRAREIERGNLGAELETNKSDELGELYRSLAAMRDALRARIRETERQNQELQQYAASFGETMEEVGDGDLTQRLDEDVDIDAMAQLAQNFNEMMDQLEQAVGEVYVFTDEVAEATDVLADQTERSMRASAEVYNVAQDIADGSDSRNVEMLAQIDESGGSDALDVDLGNGQTTAVERADGTTVDIDDTIDSIEQLGEQMDRISDVSEFITNVADETNMLALNAGIEASKVDGEGAEGFQVVAEEVKSLAQETRNSTDEIEDITEDIRLGTNDALNSILRQQAALVSMMDEYVTGLSGTTEDLRLTLAQLDVSELPERDAELDRISVESEDGPY